MEINSPKSLDLYAKVEDLLGIEEAVIALYTRYQNEVKLIQPHSLLDVGCGSGAFLEQLKNTNSLEILQGIDLSPVMVERTQYRGIDAHCIDLCKLEGRFDLVTAVFDMVNYLSPKNLDNFLSCVADHLNEDGFFVFDINTLFGFEQVAVGAFIAEDTKRFVAVESDFESNEYSMQITLFEDTNGLYRKSQQEIRQYFHPIHLFKQHKRLKFVRKESLSLYDLGKADKEFIVMQKASH